MVWWPRAKKHSGLVLLGDIIIDEQPPVDKTGILIREDNERPKLKRIYVKHLDGNFKGFRIDLTREYRSSYSNERDGYGTITQPDGKWVLVSMGRVAHEILNAELAPIIEEVLGQMAAIDQEWVRSNPTEWTDDRGVTWVRKDAITKTSST